MGKIDFRLESYDYFLPKEMIAQYPSAERDKSRLLVYHRKENRIEHRIFSEIVNFFSPGDCLMLNRTKVIPARLQGKKDTGGKVEVLLLEEISPKLWKGLVNSQVAVNKEIFFSHSLKAVLKGKEKNYSILEFSSTPRAYWKEIGEMPLPPYIKRNAQETENACLPARQGERRTERMLDRERYQTVYAKEEGAVAAPTAGLHFTKELLEKLSARGVKIVYLVLHIGPATFQPVKSADIREHNLEKEYFFLPTDTTKEINSAKKKKKKIIACGTSVVRVLELQVKNGILNPGEGYTDAYIYPGYQFQLVDTLITNFHLPKSTNLILVSAFAGREKILQLYEEAKKEKYRFYSYGDAMLII
jgi:S-adenosylmethionine:tRNA ribosyltransferase-isomerase